MAAANAVDAGEEQAVCRGVQADFGAGGEGSEDAPGERPPLGLQHGKGGRVAGLGNLCSLVVVQNFRRSTLPTPTDVGWLFLRKLIGWQRRGKEVSPGRRLKAMVGEDDGCALERCKKAGTGRASELMQQAVAEGPVSASK